MRLRGALISLLALGWLQGEELRLQRRAPDLKLRLRATYHAPGERPLSLVLGGGSAKGLAHIGVFEVLEKEGLSESAITGTSAGALMGSFRAAGFSGPGLRWAFKHTDFGNAIFDSRRRTGGMTLSEEEERQATVVRFDLRPEGWEFLPGAVAGRAATQTLQAHLIRGDARCRGDL
jgi:NTE family protein